MFLNLFLGVPLRPHVAQDGFLWARSRFRAPKWQTQPPQERPRNATVICRLAFTGKLHHMLRALHYVVLCKSYKCLVAAPVRLRTPFLDLFLGVPLRPHVAPDGILCARSRFRAPKWQTQPPQERPQNATVASRLAFAGNFQHVRRRRATELS